MNLKLSHLQSQLRTVALGTALTAASLACLAGSGMAQPAVPASAVRAINLARATAIAQNGGLSVYRPAQCMFQTANANNACLISSPEDSNNSNAREGRNTPNAYVFRFPGGAPGWQQNNQRPSVETEVTISADGRSVLQVNYNGSPR